MRSAVRLAVLLLAAVPAPDQIRPAGREPFAAEARPLAEGRIFSIAVHDVDGDSRLDGDVDLIVGPIAWINTGSGRFERVQTLGLGTRPMPMLPVDIDQDGDLDPLANRGNREAGGTQLLLFPSTLRRR